MKTAIKAIIIIIALIFVALGCQMFRVDRLNAGASAIDDDHPALALEKLMLLAWLGDCTAQDMVGTIYATGGPGITKNDAEAIYWFRRAARYVEEGEDPAAPAELEMAISYADGTNVYAKDINESMKWLRLAAAGGNKKAIALLAKAEADRTMTTHNN